jgi:hypothetical protein
MSSFQNGVDALEREGAYIGNWSLTNILQPSKNEQGQYGWYIQCLLFLTD